MTDSADSPKVKVVQEGRLVRDGLSIIDASSTVALVEAEGQRIVIDTGSPRDIDSLEDAFRRMGVALDSVKFVINTHLHVDHIGCNDIFTRARLVAHSLENPPVGSLKVDRDQLLLPGVRIVPTPGHTLGSISVFVNGDMRYAVCGDAIPTRENYEKRVPPFINVDHRLALKSMDMIIEWADVIFPGHGAPFEVGTKK